MLLLATGFASNSRSGAAQTAPPAVPTGPGGTGHYGAGRIVERNGYPEYDVDGEPFFMYGAAFFYDRIPRDRWLPSMIALRALGFNTLDLYVPWNWHELADGDFDFTGRTNPRRDLEEVLRLAALVHFQLIVRPGPVIRNEWRSGGYPAWLLERPEYGMPLRDVLEGRYPATATLQNAHSDDAAAQWMANATHMRYARRWLERALHEFDPVSGLVLGVALDDDQGAYIDNQTWPAPHLRGYLEALRATAQGVVGPEVPTFINTYQMKVTASSPVWAMGNWYQSDAYAIGEHDRSQLEFSTGLLQTRPQQPLWTSEFQAGWLQQPQDVLPQSADPTNTDLALGTMLQSGVRGVVDFPAQDTLAPAGYEAPFSNAFYAWDAALTYTAPVGNAEPSARYAPTKRFGDLVRSFGPLLAATHVVSDAAIAWLGSAFDPRSMTNADFGALADRTLATQRACRLAGLTCRLIDLRYASDGDLARSKLLLLPRPHDGPLAGRPFAPAIQARLRAAVDRGLAVASLVHAPVPAAATIRSAMRDAHRSPAISGGLDAVYAGSNLPGGGGFLTIVNYATSVAHRAPLAVTREDGAVARLPAFDLPARTRMLIPIGVPLAPLPTEDGTIRPGFGAADRFEWSTCELSAFALPWSDELRVGATTPGCTIRATIGGAARTYALPDRGTIAIDRTGVVVSERPGPTASPEDARHELPTPVPPPPATTSGELPLRRDVRLPVTDLPVVPPGEARAVTADLYADGFPVVVLQNDVIRAVVSPHAGGRAFVLEDLARGISGFDTVGALRDDVAVQPPLSASDRIAKYTHQFPAGFFNRPYDVTIVQSGARAVVRLSYAAPDAFPSGATFTRTLSLAPHARDLVVDESAVFPSGTPPEQHGVAITSLAVGDPRRPTTQRVLPGGSAYTTALPPAPSGGDANAAGLYDAQTGEAILVVSSGALHPALEPPSTPHSLVLTADIARAGTTRTIFRYDFPPDLASAQRELAAMHAR